jgi:hypothetical protein
MLRSDRFKYLLMKVPCSAQIAVLARDSEHAVHKYRLLKWGTAGKAKAEQPHITLVVQGEFTKLAIYNQ